MNCKFCQTAFTTKTELSRHHLVCKSALVADRTCNNCNGLFATIKSCHQHIKKAVCEETKTQ